MLFSSFQKRNKSVGKGWRRRQVFPAKRSQQCFSFLGQSCATLPVRRYFSNLVVSSISEVSEHTCAALSERILVSGDTPPNSWVGVAKFGVVQVLARQKNRLLGNVAQMFFDRKVVVHNYCFRN